MSVKVRVLLFARAREIAAHDVIELTLPAEVTLKEVLTALEERLPNLKTYLSICRFAVNQEFTELQTKLVDGAEVAVIPPVSGGCAGIL